MHLSGKDAHDGEGSHVEGDALAGLKLFLRHPGPDADQVPGARGRFDDELLVVHLLASGRQGMGGRRVKGKKFRLAFSPVALLIVRKN